jgi:hypothetical protein
MPVVRENHADYIDVKRGNVFSSLNIEMLIGGELEGEAFESRG